MACSPGYAGYFEWRERFYTPPPPGSDFQGCDCTRTETQASLHHPLWVLVVVVYKSAHLTQASSAGSLNLVAELASESALPPHPSPLRGDTLLPAYLPAHLKVAILYPCSHFCEIDTSLLLPKQPKAAPNPCQRRLEYGRFAPALHRCLDASGKVC